MSGTVEFFVNKATKTEIINHLSECDAEFVQTLTERVDIKGYSFKIYTKAIRFEAWAGDSLVGLVAVYCNDQNKRMAYITSVSVLSEWQGKGIAAQLIRRCIEHARIVGMHCITLEVIRGNAPAIKLYEKFGFLVTDKGESLLSMNLFF